MGHHPRGEIASLVGLPDGGDDDAFEAAVNEALHGAPPSTPRQPQRQPR